MIIASVALFITYAVNHKQGYMIGAIALTIFTFVAILVIGGGIANEYIRLKHTSYTITETTIKELSYGWFKKLGVRNNTISIKQVRQIKVFSNTRLDTIFFHCGLIVLTVSGDAADFKVTNITDMGKIKQIIELVAFGSSSDTGDANYESQE